MPGTSASGTGGEPAGGGAFCARPETLAGVWTTSVKLLQVPQSGQRPSQRGVW